MRRGASVRSGLEACGTKPSKKTASPGWVGTATGPSPFSSSGFYSSPTSPSLWRPGTASKQPLSTVAGLIVTDAVMNGEACASSRLAGPGAP